MWVQCGQSRRNFFRYRQQVNDEQHHSARLHSSECLISGNKKPRSSERGFLYWVPGSVLLSHGECHTTIGATAFPF